MTRTNQIGASPWLPNSAPSPATSTSGSAGGAGDDHDRFDPGPRGAGAVPKPGPSAPRPARPGDTHALALQSAYSVELRQHILTEMQASEFHIIADFSKNLDPKELPMLQRSLQMLVDIGLRSDAKLDLYVVHNGQVLKAPIRSRDEVSSLATRFAPSGKALLGQAAQQAVADFYAEEAHQDVPNRRCAIVLLTAGKMDSKSAYRKAVEEVDSWNTTYGFDPTWKTRFGILPLSKDGLREAQSLDDKGGVVGKLTEAVELDGLTPTDRVWRLLAGMSVAGFDAANDTSTASRLLGDFKRLGLR